ncbi:hypothetical protein ABZ569_32705 [Streptomyces albus]|uniref:hypothetical protein n=1 Tax=Streptomyces albus TaxID=1888 RepID=UPI0033C7718B
MIHESHAALPEGTARVFRLLACLPVTTFDIDGAAAALGVRWQTAALELTVLAEARLLVELGDQVGRGATYRYGGESWAQARNAVDEEESAPARAQTLRRWLDWLLVSVSRAKEMLVPSHRPLDCDVEYLPVAALPFGDEEGARAWMVAHQDDLLVAAATAEENGWETLTRQLTQAAPSRTWFLRAAGPAGEGNRS